MAGRLPSTISTFKPLHFKPNPHFSLCSLDSKIRGLCLSSPSPCNFNPLISATHVSFSAIYATAGGSVLSGSEDNGRLPLGSGDDQVLDFSFIRSNIVRVKDDQNNMVGIVSKTQALQMAKDAKLDLVVISLVADPPVVQIIDYKKYKYEQQKKKKDQQKKNAANRVELKVVKLGFNIDVNDYSIRLKAAQKFLKDGNKVKVVVYLGGREKAFESQAAVLLRRFLEDIGQQNGITGEVVSGNKYHKSTSRSSRR